MAVTKIERITNVRGIKLALVGYLVLLALQLVVYFVNGILILLAIAFETLASALIAAFLLLATHYSKKPADDVHMLGYERAQNVAAVIVAVIFITFMSVETFRRAIPKFFEPHNVSQFPNLSIALVVSAVSILVVLIPFMDILRTKRKGAALRTQLVNSLEDIVAYLAGFLGLIMLGKGNYLAEPIASTLVGMLIALSGVYLIKENVRYLMGKGPGREYIQGVESTIRLVKGVREIHGLKAEYVGPDNLFIGFHIKVAKGTPIEEAEHIVKEIKNRLGGDMGCQHCVIELEADD